MCGQKKHRLLDYPFSRQTAKFKKLAKLTQAKLGTKRIPAIIDRCQNRIIVAAIANQSRSTFTKVRPGFSRPKKNRRCI